MEFLHQYTPSFVTKTGNGPKIPNCENNRDQKSQFAEVSGTKNETLSLLPQYIWLIKEMRDWNKCYRSYFRFKYQQPNQGSFQDCHLFTRTERSVRFISSFIRRNPFRFRFILRSLQPLTTEPSLNTRIQDRGSFQ